MYLRSEDETHLHFICHEVCSINGLGSKTILDYTRIDIIEHHFIHGGVYLLHSQRTESIISICPVVLIDLYIYICGWSQKDVHT